MNFLENNIIKLRALEESDVDLLYKWENDTSIWAVSNTLAPFSRYILEKYIENSHLDIYQTRQLRLIIEVKSLETNSKNIPIGSIDIFDFDPYHNRAGIGILISENKYRQKGYATEALKILIQYSFNVLKLHQLYCNITEDNKSSLKLFQNQGFEIIGKKRDWIKSLNSWLDEFSLQLINK